MEMDNISNQIYFVAHNEAKLKSHEFVTPEHFLYAALLFDEGKSIIENSGGDINKIMDELSNFINDNFYKIENIAPTDSYMLMKMFEISYTYSLSSGKSEITLGDLLASLFNLPESFGVYILVKHGVSKLSILKYISHGTESVSKTEGQSNKQNEQGNNTDVLSKYTVDLTQKAAEGKLDPFIGREATINRTLQVLCRRTKNNPIYVGDAGVGKTAIVEGIAHKIADGSVPKLLEGAKIFYIDIGAIVAGTKYRGDFEERLLAILNAASAIKNSILYFDEIHNVVGAGAVSGGSLDAVGMLKPYLAKGELRFIGSTTFEEYKKYFEKDSALTRRFQRIDIDEPSIDDTVKILTGLKPNYEHYHNVEYGDDIIRLVCELSSKYITDRKLPDKAIDVIDEAGAFLRMNSASLDKITVTKSDIEKVISSMSKIPENSISENEMETLKTLESKLKQKIYGQEEAVKVVVNAIKASRLGLNEDNKPIASFLFVGPTGVGKTELAKQLSEILNIKMTRFDMSEYQESHSVAKLIGSPPGYVGYEEGGLLIEAMRKTPHCVLLLDEIEKSHTDILNVLLQVMDYGVLTDNSGKKADFRNAVIIMTSNAGAREMGKRIIGYDDSNINMGAIDKEVERVFPPEFRNRLNEIVVFNRINKEMAALITTKAVNALSDRLKSGKLSITDEAAEWISEKGLSEKYGAREIIRIVDKEIKKLLIDKLIMGSDRDFVIDISDGEIILRQ